MKLRSKQVFGLVFIFCSWQTLAVSPGEQEPEVNARGKAFDLKSPEECETGLSKALPLPNYLLEGQAFKESALPLRLALTELLYNHSPNNQAKDSVIADEATRKVLEDILHDRMPEEIKSSFTQWKDLLQSVLLQSRMLYRHNNLGLEKTTLPQILEREVPASVSALMVPAAEGNGTPKLQTPPENRSLFARFFGFQDSAQGAIKRPSALENYKYIGAPNLYKMLFRFDERLRVDLLKTLIQDPKTEFPQISHLEAYIITAAIPRAQQNAAWDLMLAKIITRVELFPAKLLADAANMIEPETFLKSLAANQGQLRIEEILNLIQEAHGKTTLRIEEIAKGSNFPQITHEVALELIEKYKPLDFESAYAIAWAYNVGNRSVQEVSEFLKRMEENCEPRLTQEQSERIRSKVAERIWPIKPGVASNSGPNLVQKIEIARYLGVGRTFILKRLYWQLQLASSLTEAELEAVINFIPHEPDRSTYDGTKHAEGRFPNHEIVYADHLYSDVSLELRISGSPAVKWYESDFYWMGITTNLVVANMAIQRAPQHQIRRETVQLIRNKIDELFAKVKPLHPKVVDPQNKWNIRWDSSASLNVYSFNPSQPDELAPNRRGVTLERVQEYYRRIVDRLEKK